ncbi:MAG TPA: GNAT family N-acetyltransferase [Gaiellaceae bacterium]|nr:GNAT family N-acetyltransferase [Gaiellaceae bacterium]
MHELALEQRRVLGPHAPWHVGDVTWGLRQHEGREDEWSFRLWRDGGRVVAWSWLKGDRGILEHDVHPDHRHLLDEILAEPDSRSAYAFVDDEETLATLARHGFTRRGEGFHFNHREVAERPPDAPLPDGFRLRTVEPADLAERVAVHRDVWHPSRVTESSYANVMASWPYRGSLDCIVVAPDGRFAAYVLVWPDDENRVGLFEPVGTRTEFRRLGLGKAVCTFALQRLHDEGLREAVVLCENDAACALYESVGFRRVRTNALYAR